MEERFDRKLEVQVEEVKVELEKQQKKKDIIVKNLFEKELRII